MPPAEGGLFLVSMLMPVPRRRSSRSLARVGPSASHVSVTIARLASSSLKLSMKEVIFGVIDRALVFIMVNLLSSLFLGLDNRPSFSSSVSQSDSRSLLLSYT